MNVGTGVRALLAIAAFATTPAAAGTLVEIGRTAHDAPVCGNLVVHANAAIAALARGDDALADAIERLRAGDLGTNDVPGPRRRTVASLRRTVALLDESTARGADELHRFETYALAKDDEPQRVAMRQFAHALALVLADQRRSTEDLDAFLGRLALHDVRADAVRPDPFGLHGERADARPGAVLGAASPERDEPPEAAARHLATALDARAAAASPNEARANELGELAVGGC